MTHPQSVGSQSDGSMSFLEHLRELRKRLIKCAIGIALCTVAGFLTFPTWSKFFLSPFAEAGDIKFQALGFAEGFVTQLQYSFFLGAFYAAPYLIYHLIAFLLPALTSKEKKVVSISLAVGMVLFVVGFIYCYDYILPLATKFFIEVNKSIGVDVETFNYQKNINLALQMLLAFGLMFETPLILFVLMFFGMVSRQFLLKQCRLVIVIAFIASAIVTPPDIISQFLLAVPLIAMYFITIFIAYCLRIG